MHKPPPRYWLCLTCNYPLRDLPEPRCPECGREFDPNDLKTVNYLSSPVSGLARMLLRPPLWPLNFIATGVAIYAIYRTADPWDLLRRYPIISVYADVWIALAAAMVIWGGFLILRQRMAAVYAFPELYRERHPLRWLVTPVIVLAAGIIAGTGVSFQMRMWLSRTSMTRTAEQLLHQKPLFDYPDRRFGLFAGRHIEMTLDTVRFDDGKFGYIYCPGNASELSGIAGMRWPPAALGNGWYVYDLRWVLPKMAASHVPLLRRLAEGTQSQLQESLNLLVQSFPQNLNADYVTIEWGYRPYPDKELWPDPKQSSANQSRIMELRPDVQGLLRLGAIAWPSLKAKLSDPDPAVRRAACATLGMMDPPIAEAAAEFTRLLADPEPYIRELAACALSRIGPPASAAAPALLKCLSDPDPLVAYNAAVALHRIKPADSQFQAHLVEVLELFGSPHPSPTTSPAPAGTLSRAGDYRRNPIQMAYVRYATAWELIESLGECGPLSGDASAMLSKIARTPEYWILPGGAESAGFALPRPQYLGPPSYYVPGMILPDESPLPGVLAWHARRILAGNHPPSAATPNADISPSNILPAPSTKPADMNLNSLMNILTSDRDPANRLRAAGSLAAHADLAQTAQALPLLQKRRYADPDEEVRRACAKAIDAIEGQKKSAP